MKPNLIRTSLNQLESHKLENCELKLDYCTSHQDTFMPYRSILVNFTNYPLIFNISNNLKLELAFNNNFLKTEKICTKFVELYLLNFKKLGLLKDAESLKGWVSVDYLINRSIDTDL